MKHGGVKIVDRVSAVEAIRQLGEDDLRFLNRLIVERLKLLSQTDRLPPELLTINQNTTASRVAISNPA